MIYIVVFGATSFLLFVLRRRLGIPLITVILAYFLLGWWGGVVAGWLRQIGLSIPKLQLQAIIEIVVLLGVFGIMIYKSATSSHKQSRRIIESIIGGMTLTLVLIVAISSLASLDRLSLDLQHFLADNFRLILTVASVYALYETLGSN